MEEKDKYTDAYSNEDTQILNAGTKGASFQNDAFGGGGEFQFAEGAGIEKAPNAKIKGFYKVALPAGDTQKGMYVYKDNLSRAGGILTGHLFYNTAERSAKDKKFVKIQHHDKYYYVQAHVINHCVPVPQSELDKLTKDDEKDAVETTSLNASGDKPIDKAVVEPLYKMAVDSLNSLKTAINGKDKNGALAYIKSASTALDGIANNLK